MSNKKINIKELSKLAEINITDEQSVMLENYIPQMMELGAKLFDIQVPEEIKHQVNNMKTFDQLRPDIATDYDQVNNLEIIVPIMVQK